MKIKTAVVGLILLGLVGLATAPSSRAVAADGIKWYPYDEGMVRSKADGKKTFLNFFAEWCAYCRKMEVETFKDRSVVEYLNRNFIAIQVDSDKEGKLAAIYDVRGLPTSWFIEQTGERISSLPGYVPADMLLKILKYIHTDSYKKMSFTQFTQN